MPRIPITTSSSIYRTSSFMMQCHTATVATKKKGEVKLQVKVWSVLPTSNPLKVSEIAL